ncbi:glutamate--tRNA ligase [candidate division KSB1 bacterium]|nr:MAG: glutamate--tRNA ligase [candidate division KSB1 bacterium]
MIRVRFAPSPTGYLHIGNARTAILNWLCARHYNGRFILRIEDTDVKRSSRESELSIISDLKWLGLNWDEGPDIGGKFGPYRQSERTEIYQKVAGKLKQMGRAYDCYCTDEELKRDREEDLKNKRPPKYRRRCLNLTEEEKKKKISEGRKPSVRFFVEPGLISFKDLVAGEVEFDTVNIGDFVILKSDGKPTYNFAVVVDDALMEISIVIRGNDHLSNTPKQIMLYNVLGYKLPEFAHIPMITGKDGARLSKRHGATSVMEYRKKGYLPEAMINYLSLLSWSSTSGEEILSIERLIEEFSFERISRSQATFDIKKFNWLNGYYIRNSSIERITELCKPYLTEKGFEVKDDDILEKMVNSVKDNLDYLSQISERIEVFFFDRAKTIGEMELSFLRESNSRMVLSEFCKKVANIKEFSTEEFGRVMKEIQNETGIKGKSLWMPVRLALTGRFEGPELVKILEIFGPNKTRDIIIDTYNKYLKN